MYFALSESHSSRVPSPTPLALAMEIIDFTIYYDVYYYPKVTNFRQVLNNPLQGREFFGKRCQTEGAYPYHPSKDPMRCKRVDLLHVSEGVQYTVSCPALFQVFNWRHGAVQEHPVKDGCFFNDGQWRRTDPLNIDETWFHS